MTRQSGVSILFLLALLLASVSLAITAAIGSHLLRQTNQSEEFKSVMVDVFQGMDAPSATKARLRLPRPV
ncbi:hypothetical protein Vc3S01_p10065 (plasmid) [Vibrio campbellii]|nr:hypothetical protein Vc3S01_p10065 [Vibrio campbellii]